MGTGVGQVTENDAVTLAPAGTVTGRDVPLLTVQLLAIPERTTVWLPAGRALTVMV